MHLERPAERCALAVEGCGCSLYKHTSAFWSLSFPLILHGQVPLRALLSINKRICVPSQRIRARHASHFHFILPIAFPLSPWIFTSTVVSRKFLKISLHFLLIAYPVLCVFAHPSPWCFLSCLSSFPLLKFKGTSEWKCQEPASWYFS